MLRTVLSCFAYGLAAAALSAQAQGPDPFDLLFGSEAEAVDVDTEQAPGRDDIEIVRIQLDDFILIEALVAFQTSAGLCLPVLPVFDALEVPVEIERDRAKGWFISQDRTLRLDFSGAHAQFKTGSIELNAQMTDEGWCLPLDDWSAILPIDFSYQSANLSVRLTPREILPIEARLERQALRDQMRPAVYEVPDYQLIEAPYRWLSLPTADIDLALQLTPAGQVDNAYSLELAGDILKMTGQLHFSRDGRPRFTLSRTSEAGGELGMLNARSFAMGDVVSASMPLLTPSKIAEGFVLSNRPAVSADIFDVTDIRGPLPFGWEAELYAGDQLLGFVTEADTNGDYVFSDVVLRPGYNRLTVKLFGPYGERDERIVKIMVGAELCPENVLQYSFGIVQTENKSNTADDLKTRSQPAVYASMRYGLSNRVSAQLDGIVSAKDGLTGFGVGLSGSAFGAYGVMRMASDGRGRPAMSASAQTRLGRQGSQLRIAVTDFGSMETDISGYGGQRTQRLAMLAYDTSLNTGIGRGPVALRSELLWENLADKSSQMDMSLRLAGAYRAARWSHALRYTKRDVASGSSQSDLLGDVLISRSFGGLRLRGAMSYSMSDRFALRTLALAGQKRFGKRSFGQMSISHDMSSSQSSLNMSYARTFDKFVLSANAGADQSGAVNLGLRLAFSLFPDASRGRYAMALPGLSRTGAVRPFVYDDLDDNGAYNPSDIAMPGAGFIVDHSLRGERTAANGAALLGNLTPGARTDIELKQSSIEDPFLQPSRKGVTIIPRPGRVIEVPFSLTASADIDGKLTMRIDGHYTPVSGVLIEAVNADGEILATAKSEYDGYFYLDGLPARSVLLRVAQKALDSVGAEANPVPVSLSRKQPSITNVSLTITPK